MKTTLFTALLFSGGFAFAQPQVITNATINSTTTVIAPETEDVQNIQGQGQGGGAQFFRNFGDGETKSTTIIKDEKVKTVLKNDMGRSTIIRDNNAKMTTTLIEIMGNKTGFYITDAEQAEMRIKMDSMMKTRMKDSGRVTEISPAVASNSEIVYTDQETKKIAGYLCKKALVIRTGVLGVKDTVAVWYSPEIKLVNVPSFGGTSAFGGFGNFGNFTSLSGLDKIDGMVMYYEMNMRRGRRMIVEVTKVDLKKDISEKDFEVPKDFDVKPMKEFQGMMQGMQQFRMERPQQ